MRNGAALLVLLAAMGGPASAQDTGAGAPGPEHERLAGLVGAWDVRVDGGPAGLAVGRPLLDGRFVEVEVRADRGPVRRALYTFGFDDRHGEFTVLAMDEAGTYWVTARGVREGSRVAMRGSDDDPDMAAMGLEKAFVIELGLPEDGVASIDTRLVDTRTDERPEQPWFGFELHRAGAPGPTEPDALPETLTLPPELDAVLKGYEAAWRARDAAALAALFTDDGYVMRPNRPPAVGREAIEGAYQGAGGPLVLRAWAWRVDGDVGWILGGWAGSADQRAVGKFVLALRRSPAGSWRIAADIDNGNGN